MKTMAQFLLAHLIVILLCSLTYASEVMLPATQIETGGGNVSFYYSRSDQSLSFQVHRRDEISVGANSYFSDVTNDLASSGRGDNFVVKLTLNPHDGLTYWGKLGAGNYSVDFPSAAVTNRLSGHDKGWLMGAGMRLRLFPDTIVTPALAFELSVTQSMYGLDSFASGGGAPQAVNDAVDLTEAQGAFLVSKRIRKSEIYGGLKITRTCVTLRDKTNLGSTSGIKDGAGVVLGTKIRIYPKEALVLEAGVGADQTFSAGWNIEF